MHGKGGNRGLASIFIRKPVQTGHAKETRIGTDLELGEVNYTGAHAESAMLFNRETKYMG